MRRFRQVIQILSLCFFLYLVSHTKLPHDLYIDYTAVLNAEESIHLEQPVTFYFMINPLVMVSSLLSAGIWISGFLWAVAVIILTLFLGRIFCGFICPFGAVHTIVSEIQPKKHKPLKPSAYQVKYSLLIMILLASCIGLNIAGFIDPISFLFRSLALSVFPAVGTGFREIFEWLSASDIKWLNWSSLVLEESFFAPVFGYNFNAFYGGWFIGMLFLFIALLNRVKPRFFCTVLCPLGALLGICSRFSMLKILVDQSKCTSCKKCASICPGSARLSDSPYEISNNAECLRCFNCMETCPTDAISVAFNIPKNTKGPDIGRRVVLSGLTAGITFPLLGRLDGIVHKVSPPELIRPPGALPEKQFLELCIRCGLCMKVCPTNAINPTLSEAGIAGFWTPRLVMIQGYCEYTCTLCTEVCPTGAIQKLTSQEKTSQPVRIGSAYVDRGRCLPWSGNGPCIVCEEHCPVSPKAIHMKEMAGDKNIQLPYVDLNACVGCGICENKCPVRGKPAIRVICAGESRSVRNRIML